MLWGLDISLDRNHVAGYLAKCDTPAPCKLFSDNLSVFLSLKSHLVNLDRPPTPNLGWPERSLVVVGCT